MEIGNIAKYNKGFRYLLNCIDIYTVGNKTNGKEFLRRSLTEYKTSQVRLYGPNCRNLSQKEGVFKLFQYNVNRGQHSR